MHIPLALLQLSAFLARIFTNERSLEHIPGSCGLTETANSIYRG